MQRLVRLSFAAFAALPFCALTSAAQATLALDEAITIAKRNNSTYQQTVNTRKSTSLGVRSAYAAFGPTSSSSIGFGWREGKPTFYEGTQIGLGIDSWNSSYSVGLNLNYDLRKVLGPSQAKARLEVADADVVAAEQNVRRDVTTRYWTAVQSARSAILQDSLLLGFKLAVDLAAAKERTGSGTALETKSAEVRFQQQQLQVLSARNAAANARLQLFIAMGVPESARDVQFTTELPVTEPRVTLDALLADAKARNPGITRDRANERSAGLQKRTTLGGYIPSFSISTGFGGQTNMADTATGRYRTWPWGFESNARSVNAGFSLTLWDGYNREVQVQQAAITVTNARIATRQRELQIVADVTSAYQDLTLAWQSIDLNNRAVATAREALVLAQEKYRLGSATYVELQQQSDAYQRSENDRLVGIYNYHRNFAVLEAAVGRSLR